MYWKTTSISYMGLRVVVSIICKSQSLYST